MANRLETSGGLGLAHEMCAVTPRFAIARLFVPSRFLIPCSLFPALCFFRWRGDERDRPSSWHRSAGHAARRIPLAAARPPALDLVARARLVLRHGGVGLRVPPSLYAPHEHDDRAAGGVPRVRAARLRRAPRASRGDARWRALGLAGA